MKKLNILLPLAFFMILSACTTSDENVATNVKPKVEPLIDNVANSTIKNNPIESNQSSQIEPEIKLELNTTKKKELAKEPIASITEIPRLFGEALPGLEAQLNFVKIPKVKTIGILPYPNAFIINIEEKSSYKGKMYTNMEMVSEDAVEKVLAFYVENRKHWEHIVNDNVHTFKKEEDKYFRETNTLQILNINKILYQEIDSLLGNNAKTLIRIYFEEGDNDVSPNLLGLAYSAPVE